MKNYIEEKNYVVEDAIEELLKDLNNDLASSDVDSIKYGKGKLVRFTKICENSTTTTLNVAAEFEFEKEAKPVQFYIDLAIKVGSLKFDESFISRFNEYAEPILKISEESTAQNRTAMAKELERQKQEKEKRELEEKQKKAEIKAKSRKESNISAANKLSANSHHLVNNYYYHALGYIAKHVKNITAAMPDYLDKWFVREFGDVERRVVDQSKLSPSGLPSQFALYMKIDLDTNENIPSYLERHLGDVKKDIKPISDTQFVFDIMKNEGFKFGKTQDIDEILNNIPSEFLDDFEKGYSL